MATMFASHAGMRDKEIRILMLASLDLNKRMVTVGENKTDAGTRRTIPMNEDLYCGVVEYLKWYMGRFDLTEDGLTKRADQSKCRDGFTTTANTFVTDLAESGAGDEVIRDMAGHVSKEMLKHYSHIRTQRNQATL
jgi:integrase